MNGEPILYVDQYGCKYYCIYVKDLKEKYYLSGKVSKMYVDTKKGETLHIGYVVGDLWLEAFTPKIFNKTL